MRAIMDALSPSHPAQRVVFMKAAQVGATEAGNCFIGFVMHHAPGPMLAVQPTVELAKRNSRQRIDPLIEESPALRERVQDNQIERGDMIEADRDLVGGFVLDAGGSPLPTWQGLRPMGLLASMLGDPALTRGTLARGEAGGQIIQLTESLRFLRQLMAEERLGHMYADPDLALGGVRASLWDQTMPLTGSALGLVTLAETLESLSAVSTRPPAAAGGP